MSLRRFFYDLPVDARDYHPIVHPDYRDTALLHRRYPKLPQQYYGSDFTKHQHMLVLLAFEKGGDRSKFGLALDVRPLGWCEERTQNPAWMPQNDVGERWHFRFFGVLYEIAVDMSDDDYLWLLLSGKIATDREKVGLGYSEFPRAWQPLCSTMVDG